jgi:hypothetical protein
MVTSPKLETQNSKPVIEAAWVLALMALAVTAFLWAAIFTGRYFSPSDLLYAYSPWTSVQPPGWTEASVSNPTQIDVSVITEPWLEYGAKRLHAGELPLWNPDNMLGAPFIGNDQSGIFYPANWLYFLLPSPWMLVVLAWVRLFLAAVGAYLLARQVARVSPIAAGVAALTYAFGPFMISWLFWNLSTVVSWLPWLWWATARLFESTELRAVDDPVTSTVHRPPSTVRVRFAVLALIVALSFLAGHPESSYDMAVGTGLFALFCVVRQSIDFRKDGRSYSAFRIPRSAFTGLALWIGAYLAGVLLAAVQIFPTIEYILQSQVFAGRTTSGRMPATLGLPYMWTLFSPDFFGNPAHHNVWLNGPTYEESNTYSGAGTLLLAPFAFLVRDRARRWLALFLLLVGVLAMGIIYHWPLIYDLANVFPFMRSTATRRFLMYLPLVLGLLAAMGIDEIRERLSQRRLLLWVGTVLAMFVAVGVVVPWALSHSFFGVPGDSALANSVWSENVWRALAVLLATSMALLAVIMVGRFRPRSLPWALFLLPLVVYADLWQARWDFNPTVAPANYFPDTPATQAIQADQAKGNDFGPARTLGILSFIQNANLHYGITDLRGYDSIEPHLYRDIAVLIEPSVRDVPGGRVTTFYPPSAQSPLLNMLNVRYLIMPPGEDPNYLVDVRQDKSSAETVGEIRGDNRPGQTFTAQADNLGAIQVLGATFGGKARDRLVFHLKSDPTAPADLVTQELDASTLPDNTFWMITFPTIHNTKGRSFYFYFEAPGALPGDGPTLWYNSSDVYAGGTHTQNGSPSKGDLVFRTLWPVPFSGSPRFNTLLQANPPSPYVYENSQAFSRAWLVHAAEVFTDGNALLNRLVSPTFDASHLALLNAPLSAGQALTASSSSTSDSVQIVDYQPESVFIVTNSLAPGLLMLSDQYFPGWEATVDGQPSAILQADDALRAVYVPAGQHSVHFSYQPLSFRLGAIASGLTLLALVLLFAWGARDARRETRNL